MTTLLSDETFQRWLAQEASPEEMKRWQTWLEEDKEHQMLYRQALNLWQMVQVQPAHPPDVEIEWPKLLQRVGLQQARKEASKSVHRVPLGSYTHHSGRSSWLRSGAFAVAAFLLFMLVKYSAILDSGQPQETQDYQVLTTEFGQRATVTFPDETRIILNAKSTLRYPTPGSAATANIFELEGEAYFEVTPRHDPDKKFMIRTVDGTVSVVGTEFAVYERGSGTRVVVTDGRVSVRAADTTTVRFSESKKQVVLDPGHLLHIRKGSHQLKPMKVAVEPYMTWWRTHLILVHTPFEEIVQRLEETYGVDVQVLDQHLLERTLSGSIENQNLVVVTDALAEALQVSVRRNGQIITFGSQRNK